jgi:hypothetical protein
MTRHREVWGALYREFQEVRRAGSWQNDTPGNVSAICGAVMQWAETGNPFYMDYALEIALDLDAPQTPTFVAELRNAMHVRRDGTATGTWPQVRRAYMKDRAFQLVCNLRYHGTPIAEASEKASVWLDKFSGGEFCMKASSVERQYQAEFVKPGHEAKFHAAWAADDLPLSSADWDTARANLPGIAEGRQHRRGDRR